MGVSVTDICKSTGMANGNLNYYFKHKGDIAKEVLGEILKMCGEEAEMLTSQKAPGLDFAYCGTFLFMVLLCLDPHYARFFLELYESSDSRNIVVFFVDYYHGFFPVSITDSDLSSDQSRYMIVADTHAKLGILKDLLQRTDFHPSLLEIHKMAEAAFLVTCHLCSISDSDALESISNVISAMENYDYNRFLDKVKASFINQTEL